ncbi:MAG: hypothetical protein ABIM99_05465 [Candidatus Dojkabacteria bacterium]
MGLFDTAKMMQKAMKARNSMSSIKAVGKGGSLAIIIDGLYATKKAEVSRPELKAELSTDDDKLVEKVARLIEKNVMKANEDARKQLESELRQNTSMDQLKDMFSE